VVGRVTQTLLVADYSSLEIGIQGDFALRLFGDDQIIEMYRAQAAGVDMHSNNARAVFGTWLGWVIPASVRVEGELLLCKYAGETVDKIPVEEFKKHPYGKLCRDLIKAIWYGMAYGKGAYGFSTLVGADGAMIGEETAGKMVEALLDSVPAMRAWFKWVERFVRKHHGVYSLGGRWCDLSPEMESGEDWMHRRAFRRAYNFPMQSTGAEIIGDAMVRVSRDEEFRSLGYRICLQVHDELVCRGPLENLTRATELLVLHMTSATANGTPLLFPAQVSWGHGSNYFEAK
jgi:DNA polymerase I-like protein with 3'-5' exonuclease and polymerase domains